MRHQQELDEEFLGFVDALEGQTFDVVRKAILILAHEVPPDARIRSCIRTLIAEIGRPAECTLLVHREDALDLEHGTMALPWTLRADDDVLRGTCKLVARQGEWQSSFAGRLEQLLAVVDSVGESLGDQEEWGDDTEEGRAEEMS